MGFIKLEFKDVLTFVNTKGLNAVSVNKETNHVQVTFISDDEPEKFEVENKEELIKQLNKLSCAL
jgi:hypothetical protein